MSIAPARKGWTVEVTGLLHGKPGTFTDTWLAGDQDPNTAVELVKAVAQRTSDVRVMAKEPATADLLAAAEIEPGGVRRIA